MTNEKQIFPREIIEHSVEKHFADYNPNSRGLYLALLVLFAIAFLLLFLVRVDVTVRSPGIIRPVQERTDIRSPVSGIVDSVFISENQHAAIGQPLIKVQAQGVREKGVNVASQKAELNARHADLQKLLAGNSAALQSELYQQQYALYRQRMNDAQLRMDMASKTYDRFAELYRSRAISAAEFERYDYDLKSARNELRLVREQQRSQWQGDLSRLELDLKQLNAQLAAIEEERNMYLLKASVAGTVQRLKYLAPGTFVAPSEVLGEISPDSGLIAEVHVSTRDIGMLRPGGVVKMQVDAYEYNIWGSLKGRIIAISEDVFTDRELPYFRVMCALDSKVLHMRNGMEGPLKKGMTVRARFVVARRTLFQLLYDDASDWLNPNEISTNDPGKK